MVRGLSAVLAVLGAALAYFLVAPSLPAISPDDTAVLVAGACGLVVLGICGLVLAGAWDEPFVLAMLVLGAGIVSACLADVNAPELELVTKAVAAGALGLLAAFALRSPTVFLGVALLVAGIDLISVFAGPTEMLRNSPEAIDWLSFSLPMWGLENSAVQIGVATLVFLGFFAGSAWRFGLRRRLTGVCMLAGLAGSVAVAVALERPAPAIAALAIAVLVPNLDRLPGVLRAERGGTTPSARIVLR